MGQKVSPTSLRVGIHKDWASRWFGGSKYPAYLKDDFVVREFLEKRLKNTSVDHINIERGTDTLNITIHTARPGLIIGRGGSGIEELKTAAHKLLKKKIAIRMDVHEIKSPDSSAAVVAESIVDQIEKRIPYRRVIKQALSKISANRDVKGAKVRVSGRLNGAEIARSEHLEQGSLPLQTLRANIDYAQVTAITTYGTIGVKVWIYKGEVFNNKKK
jgi:small subunit ribosomal protein S3